MTNRPRAIQFGAGAIGRGFLGQLFYQNGYETAFVDVDAELVRLLNVRGGYPLRVVSKAGAETLDVSNVRALLASEVERVAEEVSRAAIVSTAVGAKALPSVIKLLVAGILLRLARGERSPLDLLVCENLPDPAGTVVELVRSSASEADAARVLGSLGIVPASIGRMVPVPTPELKREDPLLLVVEKYCELPVDASGFKRAPPSLPGLKLCDNFRDHIERKVYIHNTGHAVVAYLAWLKGYALMSEAMNDPDLVAAYRAAVNATADSIARRHNSSRAELAQYIAGLEERFGVAALGDTVERVARDPIRKLGENDRLVGALKLVRGNAAAVEVLARATAAAIIYYNEQDPSSVRLRELLKNKGVEAVLCEVCSLDPSCPEYDLLRERTIELGQTLDVLTD